MALFYLSVEFDFVFLAAPLWGGLHDFYGAWLCCSSLEWSHHSASLRLALHGKNHTLHPIQLSVPGWASQ
jgi:hypothetical protein